MRKALIQRKTKETEIQIQIFLDSTETVDEKTNISTTVPFLDHMLDLFAFHSSCILQISAKGDTEIDYHHTVEDTGICLGQAIQAALGEKKGIHRYGFFLLPMDEARAEVALDFSGRPYFVWQGIQAEGQTGNFEGELVEEFFQALCVNAGMTLHINVAAGKNLHHIIEAVFKGFARAFRMAVNLDGSSVLPSTKGVL